MFRRPRQTLDLGQVQNDSALFNQLKLEDRDLDLPDEDVYKDPFRLDAETPPPPRQDFDDVVVDFDQLTTTDSETSSVISVEDTEYPASWDAFYQVKELPVRLDKKQLSLMLSERTSYELDTVLQDGAKVIPQQRLVSCLYNLAIGRQSLMFYFSEKRMAFVPVSSQLYRLPACTAQSITEITQFCLTCGSQLRRLKYTVQKINEEPEPVLVAFADCITLIVSAIERHLVAPKVQLLELFDSLQAPAKIIDLMAKLVGCSDVTRRLKLNRLPDAHKLIDSVYSRTLLLESSGDKLFELAKLLLQRTTEPYFRSLEDMLGMGPQTCKAQLFLNDADGGELEIDRDKVPRFLVGHEDSICQTLRCFRLLRKYMDSWTNTKVYHLTKPRLEWLFDTQHISWKRQQVTEYEQRIAKLDVVQRSGQQQDTEDEPTSATQLVDRLLNDMDMDADTATATDRDHVGANDDELAALCSNILQNTYQSSSSSMSPMDLVSDLSLAPLINLQARWSNSLLMQLFTAGDELDIRSHLKMAEQVLLLRNGPLCVYLQEAIFENLFQTWPPAAPQLNRYLSDIVENTIQGLGVKTRSAVMNFGLGRPIKREAYNATDMLKMCYNVPEALQIVFTRSALQIYDRLFRRLLQAMRLMHHVAAHNASPQEARHFVWCLASHYQSAITTNFVVDKFDNLQSLTDQHSRAVRHIAREFYLHDELITQHINQISQSVLDNEATNVQALVEALPELSSLRQLLNYNHYYG